MPANPSTARQLSDTHRIGTGNQRPDNRTIPGAKTNLRVDQKNGSCTRFWKTLPNRLRVMALAATALCLVAMATAANATYMSMKAVFAQQLIANAWNRTLQNDGARHPPWPWADTSPVARLQIDAIQLDTWVLEGSDGTALAFGPGMSSGSAGPGHTGVTVIGAHRDTHFKPLQHIKAGDSIKLQDRHGSWHEYQITSSTIADIRTDSISAHSDRSRLVLVTCYPFDSIIPGGPLRLVLEAELV